MIENFAGEAIGGAFIKFTHFLFEGNVPVPGSLEVGSNVAGSAVSPGPGGYGFGFDVLNRPGELPKSFPYPEFQITDRLAEAGEATVVYEWTTDVETYVENQIEHEEQSNHSQRIKDARIKEYNRILEDIRELKSDAARFVSGSGVSATDLDGNLAPTDGSWKYDEHIRIRAIVDRIYSLDRIETRRWDSLPIEEWTRRDTGINKK